MCVWSYGIRKGKAKKIADYVYGETAGGKLEKDTGRVEETCGKKYICRIRTTNEDGVFAEREGKSPSEVGANETRVASNGEAKFGDERDARAQRDGGE